MKKLLLLIPLLFLSSGCVTTTGIGVSHIWSDPDYVYSYRGGYSGVYLSSLGISYMANPFFYTPYYYRRAYVKFPYRQHQEKHHGYGGHYKAVFPAHNKRPHRMEKPMFPAPVRHPSTVSDQYRKDKGKHNNEIPSPHRGNSFSNKSNRNKPPGFVPPLNNNFNTENNKIRPKPQVRHINKSFPIGKKDNMPTVQRQKDNFNRGFSQQREGGSRPTFGRNNGHHNRMGKNPRFGNRSGSKR